MMHSGPIDAYEEWWIGDKQVEIDGTGRVITPPFANAGVNYAYIDGMPGTPDQAASPRIMGLFPGVWTPAHQLKGIAYFVSQFASPPAENYQTVFPEGYNSPVRAVARLSRVYDPRTGLTEFGASIR
jgi:hypothetical protein